MGISSFSTKEPFYAAAHSKPCSGPFSNQNEKEGQGYKGQYTNLLLDNHEDHIKPDAVEGLKLAYTESNMPPFLPHIVWSSMTDLARHDCKV